MNSSLIGQGCSLIDEGRIAEVFAYHPLSSSHYYPCMMCKLPTYILYEVFDALTILESWFLQFIWGISSSHELRFPELNTIHSWESREQYVILFSLSDYLSIGIYPFSPAFTLGVEFRGICSTFRSLIADMHLHYWCPLHHLIILFGQICFTVLHL